MNYPHTINEKTITVIVDGKPRTISASNANFTKVKALLLSGEHSEIPTLLDVRASIEKMGNGDLKIVGNKVFYMGSEIRPYQSQKIISMMKAGHKDINPYRRMVERLAQNVSSRAQDEFPRFAEYKELPIDEDGFVYAFKGIQGNNYSCWGNTHTRVLKGKVDSSGHIWNGVGEEIEVDRRDVCDDFRKTCAEGLHAGSRDFGEGYGEKLCLIKFDPKDVVCIPCDAEGQKMRLCHYWVISDTERGNVEVHAPVLTAEGKSPKKAKANAKGYNRGHYYAKFCSIVRNYGIGIGDRDVVASYMDDAGFTDEEIVDELFHKFVCAVKIVRYCKNKGGNVTLRQIASRMKAESLTQDQIEEIMAKFGYLA